MNSKLYLIVSITAIVIINSCGKNVTNPDYVAEADCTGITPTYSNSIESILNTNCALSGCHNNSSKKSGISLEGYSNASKEFLENKDNLIAIYHGSGVSSMPKGKSKLDDNTIKELVCWVKNGCPQ